MTGIGANHASRTNEPHPINGLAGGLESVVAELQLYRAADFARLGEYETAEAVLSSVVTRRERRGPHLHLLARIYAQQGRFDDAVRVCTEALSIEPDNEAYRACLHRASHPRANMRRAAAIVIPVLAILMIVLATMPILNEEPAVQEAEEATDAAPLSTVAETRRLLSSELFAAGLDDIEVREDSSGTTLLFREGLFKRGNTIEVGPAATLNAIGELLAQVNPNVDIVVIGHTDNVPPRPDAWFGTNTSLGWQRAVAVAEQLARVSGVPNSKIRVQSSGEDSPPYPNDSAESAAKNRTVTIRFQPRAN